MENLNLKSNSCIFSKYISELEKRFEGKFDTKDMLTNRGIKLDDFYLYYEFMLDDNDVEYEVKMYRHNQEKYEFQIAVLANKEWITIRHYKVQDKTKSFTFFAWYVLWDLEEQLKHKGLNNLDVEKKKSIIEGILDYMWINS